jgi:hypothetical protein
MLDHYLHTAHGAHLAPYPGREVIVLPEPRERVIPEVLAGKPDALSWLQDEYQPYQLMHTRSNYQRMSGDNERHVDLKGGAGAGA